MEWTKSCRTLERDLKGKKHPGTRIKIIREAKNRVGDSKGKFGQNDFCKILVEKGALDASDQARRRYKHFENGERKATADTEPIPTVLSLLEVTPEFAGYNEEPRTKADPGVVPKADTKGKKAKSKHKPLTLKVHNYHTDKLTIAALYDHDKNELELFICHGDWRIPVRYYEEKIGSNSNLKEIWVRDCVTKYGSDKDLVADVPGKAKVVL